MYHRDVFAPLEHGRYVVSDLIGEGAMGLVYRAFDRELGQDVALKTLRASLPDDIYHLKKEFRALIDLDHPNLVHLYDLVVGSNQCFFTMELISGPRLDRWIRSDSNPAAMSRRAAGALWQLAAGLSALHLAGKLHRDIKPSNVLVADDERVVLLDMGLVSHFLSSQSRRSQHGQLAGTLEYMAPEQGRGELLTPASDWFAAGVVLYEALAGRLPWPDPGGQHLGTRPPEQSPQECTTGVSEQLSRLVLDLLQRDPEARPTHSQVLARL
jgi:serine/threonine protein kinase